MKDVDFEIAIEEILRHAPLNLNSMSKHVDPETKTRREFQFSDDHLFTIELPAWVFRALKTWTSSTTR